MNDKIEVDKEAVADVVRKLTDKVSALTQENEGLQKSLKLVQSHAKKAMDNLPSKWNQGFSAGQASAGFCAIESARGMADIKQQWSSDNAKFTEEIMKLEEDRDEWRPAAERHLDVIVEWTQKSVGQDAEIKKLTQERDEYKGNIRGCENSIKALKDKNNRLFQSNSSLKRHNQELEDDAESTLECYRYVNKQLEHCQRLLETETVLSDKRLLQLQETAKERDTLKAEVAGFRRIYSSHYSRHTEEKNLADKIMRETAQRCAVVRIWKDNPNDCEVVEYVPTMEAGFHYIMGQKKSTLFNWEVRKYE